MIQDIFPHKFYNEYKPVCPKEDDLVFAFFNRKVMLGRVSAGGDRPMTAEKDMALKGDRDIRLPSAGIFLKQGLGENLIYLFRIDRTNYYLYPGDSELKIEGYEYYSTRIFRKLNPKVLCFAGMTAEHLSSWYGNHRFCGRCGEKTEPAADERKLSCPACGNQIYPVIAPAVIVGVISRNRLLLTRYRDRPYRGVALIAGFCEIGESVEDTVRREVMEEAGLRVKNLRYYKSQPWGFADNILMGYYCETDGDDRVSLDDQELAVAEWHSREEIGEENADLSLTADMIMHFKKWGSDVLMSPDYRRAIGKERSPDETGKTEEKGKPDYYVPEESPPDRIRRLWQRHIPGLSEPRKGESAVLIPLVFKEGEYHILFEKRAETLVIQPGEVCFPGGGTEPGESPVDTALRETAEELLVKKEQIEILAALDPVQGPGGASIRPFAGIIHHYEGTWSPDEVDYTFTVPFSELAAQNPEEYPVELRTVPGEDFPYDLIPGGKDYGWRAKRNTVCFYRGYPEIIWGITAKMLYEFIKCYRKQ